MIDELFKITVKLKEYPEFEEATAKEVYEIALRLMEVSRLTRINSTLEDTNKQLRFIDISLGYIE